jgi:hypothetical protein
MSQRTSLKLVTYNPNDYSLGEVLVKDTQQAISDSSSLSAILSLFFQWRDRATCHIVLEGNRSPIPASMDYDREDRFPSELKLTVVNEVPIGPPGTHKLKIRIELFRQCYEFDSALLDASVSDGICLFIVGMPGQILSFKQRRLPRVTVSVEDAGSLPDCFGLLGSEKLGPLRVTEIGTKAIRIALKIETQLESVILGGTEIPVEKVRISKGDHIYSFKFASHVHLGVVFDYYRQLAYPHIRPRCDFTAEELLGLYSDTNYLGKFQTEATASQRLDSLKDAWNSASQEFHRITADYVSTDDDNNLTGASSASLAFFQFAKPVWVFHQLCAKTLPHLLEQSGELYTWRADYLASRTEDLSVLAWFDSKSRWLERIYVKFAFHKNRSAKLRPVAVIRKNFSPSINSGSLPTKKERFGNEFRVMVDNVNSFGGAYPKFLNASGILDAIVSLEPVESESALNAIGATLASAVGADRLRLEVSVPFENKDKITGSDCELLHDVDRICSFDKSSLVDFIASVEHSIAVTQRKKVLGEVGDAA